MPETDYEIRSRQLCFAVLLSPYKPPTRKDGLAFVDQLSEQRLPDFSYRYNQNPQKDGTQLPGLSLIHQDGRAKFEIQVDHLTGNLRFLANQLLPASRDIAEREIGEAFTLFMKQFHEGLAPVHAEYRYAIDIPTRRGTARTNLASRFLGVGKAKLLKSNVDSVSVQLVLSAEERPSANPLDNPERQLKIEPLVEDSRRLFVEIVSKWPMAYQKLDVAKKTVTVRPGPLQEGLATPREYLAEVGEYLSGCVIPFIYAGPKSD